MGIAFSSEIMTKFAELIVQECASQIQELTPPKVTDENLQELVNSAYTMGLEVGVAKIKKHFGVEE